MVHPMRIELTRVGLLVYLANHYTTRGAPTMLEGESFDFYNSKQKNYLFLKNIITEIDKDESSQPTPNAELHERKVMLYVWWNHHSNIHLSF